MKICVVIAEYNPLTNGHLYHISKAKAETGCDTLIVLLSGSFSNHGEVCIADKHTRAQWALKAGADCVLELPTVYSLSSPKIFALGALRTLKPLGNFTLSFGSETENFESIENAVENIYTQNKDFNTFFKNFMADSVPQTNTTSTSKFTTKADESYLATSVDNINPNSFWAFEYIKAAKELKMEIPFHTVKLVESKGQIFISAKDVRKLLKTKQDVSKSLPPFVLPTSPDYAKIDALCIYALNNLSLDELKEIAGVKDGLESRLKRTKLSSMKEVGALALNQLSRSDLKKVALCATLALKQNLIELALNSKPYYRVLALKENRGDIMDYLSTLSQNVFLKPEDCSTKNKIKPLVDMDEKANKFYSLVK